MNEEKLMRMCPGPTQTYPACKPESSGLLMNLVHADGIEKASFITAAALLLQAGQKKEAFLGEEEKIWEHCSNTNNVNRLMHLFTERRGDFYFK